MSELLKLSLAKDQELVTSGIVLAALKLSYRAGTGQKMGAPSTPLLLALPRYAEYMIQMAMAVSNDRTCVKLCKYSLRSPFY